jgi:tRNA(Ile)-lysidine synthetase-like protein
MPKLTHPLPSKYWVAVSGGIDSMSFLHFLNKPSRRESLLGVAHINHATKYGEEAEDFLRSYCKEIGVEFRVNRLNSVPPRGESKECWWREQRYAILDSYKTPIVLGHHLDDCLEEYIMCTMVRGFEGTIPYQRGNCVRPFRLWKRSDIKKYAEKNNVQFIEDPSNFDTKYKRNQIRLDLVPKLLELNPGLYRIVSRVIEKQDYQEYLARTTGGM